MCFPLILKHVQSEVARVLNISIDRNMIETMYFTLTSHDSVLNVTLAILWYGWNAEITLNRCLYRKNDHIDDVD